MVPIICADCGKEPFAVRPSGLFRCVGCGAEIDRRDIDLDGPEEWCVGPDGILGKVIDPAVCVVHMREALDELLDAEVGSYEEAAALRDFRDAAFELLAGLRAGLPAPANL